ncbi:hypothetical protein NVV95_08330 [Herbiconiux sp. CPCC 205716]|uniref:SseB protein N-terminal domain-containing protein n=1 Tax=Herbiconiux gentiana TaxID=2970912 RepID=A0ABT2GEC8_9MICO|nr:hypothetical protein [Herbiconiux gentiana]MCS5714558.1 hypothetical protein [Herbiconiux gentiana]
MENADQPSLDPSPEQVGEIDRRAAALRDQPDSFAAMDALWRAVYSLDRWIFIARGTDEQPGPYAGELAQGPMLFAFTTGDRARAAGLGAGLSDDEASRLLAMPLPSAIEWAASFAAVGVKGIAFDLPTHGYFAPLSNLIPMRDHMATTPPPAD